MAQSLIHPQRQKDHFRTAGAPSQPSVTRDRVIRTRREDHTAKSTKPFSVKAVALVITLVALLGISWASDGLFLTELLTVSGILALVALVRWIGNSSNA